jgi:hypothetical protein
MFQIGEDLPNICDFLVVFIGSGPQKWANWPPNTFQHAVFA